MRVTTPVAGGRLQTLSDPGSTDVALAAQTADGQPPAHRLSAQRLAQSQRLFAIGGYVFLAGALAICAAMWFGWTGSGVEIGGRYIRCGPDFFPPTGQSPIPGCADLMSKDLKICLTVSGAGGLSVAFGVYLLILSRITRRRPKAAHRRPMRGASPISDGTIPTTRPAARPPRPWSPVTADRKLLP